MLFDLLFDLTPELLGNPLQDLLRGLVSGLVIPQAFEAQKWLAILAGSSWIAVLCAKRAILDSNPRLQASRPAQSIEFAQHD